MTGASYNDKRMVWDMPPKINIAGAGPSGLISGIVLAKAGYAVTIHEARESVGALYRRFSGSGKYQRQSRFFGMALSRLEEAPLID